MDKSSDAINVGKNQLISSKILFEEEQYRDSITLSYFAMFSSARALLLKKGISPKTHEGTLRLFAKEYVRNVLFSRRSFGFLYDARETRNDSSYGYSKIFSQEDAQVLISQAEEFIDEVETLL